MLGVPLMSVPIRSSPLADPDREVPIRYLLASGQCTPACLLALVDDGSCQCRCDGTFHGIGADLTVNVERHVPMGTVAVPVGDIKTRNQALQMPDGCEECDRIAVREDWPTSRWFYYYPFKWGSDGRAEYQCARGHYWTCWWPINTPGRAPYFRGVGAQ